MTASRVLLCLVLTLTSLVCLGSARSHWLDHRPSADAASCLEISPPNEHSKVALKRINARYRITDQLLAREITLFEAAAWFRFLNESPSNYPEQTWRLIPGATDEEKLCRQVILWMTNRLAGGRQPSAQAEEVIRALEKNLADHLAANGGRVVLPSPE